MDFRDRIEVLQRWQQEGQKLNAILDKVKYRDDSTKIPFATKCSKITRIQKQREIPSLTLTKIEPNQMQIAKKRNTVQVRNPKITNPGGIAELGRLLIHSNALFLPPHLPIDKAGIDHGRGGAPGGALEEGFKRLIEIGADATAAVLEALPPPDEQHGLPQRAERLPPGGADHARRPEVGDVEGGGDPQQKIKGKGREVVLGIARGGGGRRRIRRNG